MIIQAPQIALKTKTVWIPQLIETLFVNWLPLYDQMNGFPQQNYEL